MKSCTKTLILTALFLFTLVPTLNVAQAQTPISEEKRRKLGNFDPGGIFGNPAGATRKRDAPAESAGSVKPARAPRVRAGRANRREETTAIVSPAPTPEPSPLPTASPIQPVRSEAAPPKETIASSSLSAPAKITDQLSASAEIARRPSETSGNKLSLILASLLVASCTLVVMVVKLIKLKSEPS